MSTRVLVTGGAGYVGSILVENLLSAGHPVRVLDSCAVGDGRSLDHVGHAEGFELLRADVRDPQARAKALDGVVSVVHLAAIVGDPACSRDPELARDVNLAASRALLGEAASSGVERFVFASTCSNYGRMAEADTAYATEEWELRPVSLYAETKVAVELDVLAAATPAFATTCLRFATVYGVSPRMRFDLTVNEFARDSLVTGQLMVYGEQFWRPYVHVRDAARAVGSVLGAPIELVAGQVFNVGDTAENLRKQDLVELILERLPETAVERVARTEDPRDYRVSFERIRETLAYRTEWTVPDGVDEVLELLRSGAISDPYAPQYRNDAPPE